jgi:16S rRNA G1207 methylase RsmC
MLAGFEALGTTLLLAKGNKKAIAGAIDASCGWGDLAILVVRFRKRQCPRLSTPKSHALRLG